MVVVTGEFLRVEGVRRRLRHINEELLQYIREIGLLVASAHRTSFIPRVLCSGPQQNHLYHFSFTVSRGGSIFCSSIDYSESDNPAQGDG